MNQKQERIENIRKVVALETPDYVPIEHVVTPELAIEYAGYPMFEGLWDTSPVSYTHLDVYKRQTICRKRTKKQTGAPCYRRTCFFITL